MLVLSRKHNQDVVIGDNITIKVLSIKGNTVRLGIEAPSDVRIVRGELPVQATITVVHSDPAGETYTESESAVIPISGTGRIGSKRPAVRRNLASDTASNATSNPATSIEGNSSQNAEVAKNRIRDIIEKAGQRSAMPDSLTEK